MNDRIYCYCGTDILINKLNIRDTLKLSEAERRLTMLRIYDLIENPIHGDFDLNHLKKIHGYIFQDLYSWAGSLRVVDIAKSNMFCKYEFIGEQADALFNKLQKEFLSQNFSTEEFIKQIAWYFSEINALHPFREGNGRVQREFIRELIVKKGYKVYFEIVTPKEMIDASKDSFLCSYKKMEELFRKVISK